MAIATLLKQALTIQRRGVTGTDEYGNEVIGTSSSVATTGYVEQTDATEITVDRETYVTNWKVFLPTGTAVDGSDRVVYGTRVFEVIGTPHAVWNPRTATTHHLEAAAREVAG